MFGDDDPDIAPFFARFLAEGGHNRYSSSSAQLCNGLAVGLAGAAAILEESAAPREKKRYEKAESFHRMLEDLANGIMVNGPDVHVSREISPRSAVSDPPLATFSPRSETLQSLPRSFLPLEQKVPDQAYQSEEPPCLEDGSDVEDGASSSDDGAMDAVEILKDDAADKYPRKFPPTDFGATRPLDSLPANSIRLSVELSTGRRLFDNVNVDLDSSMEDMYDRVETKLSKKISTLITRHGMELERADLPLKWSGLQDGDLITAVHHAHPPSRERRFETVSTSLDGIATTRFKEMFSSTAAAVSMGAFGDTIATATGAYPSSQTASASSRMPTYQSRTEAVQAELPSHWFGGPQLATEFQSGNVKLNVVPPIPPGSDVFKSTDTLSLPMPPACMPDEFEELPEDAYLTHQQRMDVSGEATAKRELDSTSPSRSQQPRKAADSPPPPTAAALGTATTPTSSRLSDLSHAPTPARRSHALAGQSRTDPDDSRKKMEDKQRQNDAIWASIAASLEPAQLEPTKRTFLSHAASAGGLSRKMQPLAKRHR